LFPKQRYKSDSPIIENKRNTQLSDQLLIQKSSSTKMTDSPKSSSVKSEFTEVITMTDLLNVSTVDEFPTVLTETTLLQPPTHSETDIQGIVARYNETFTSPDDYQNFVEAKLGPWTNTLEFKCFDIMYKQHRLTTDVIAKLRQQAQLLLEEANALQGRDYMQRKEIENHIRKITRRDLRARILKPTKVRFRTTFPSEIGNELPSTRIPSFASSSSRIQTTNRPPVSYARTTRPLRCFQCDSPNHIKWYCSLYTCPLCKIKQPGHAQKNCPNRSNRRQTTRSYDDGERGFFDIDGYEDQNLNGEC